MAAKNTPATARQPVSPKGRTVKIRAIESGYS